MLRRERELRQVNLREVAEATKINVRYLEALERNDFEYLPGGAFDRGFIRAYARYIGVDEAEMVDAYLYERQQQSSGTPDHAHGLDRLRGHFSIPSGREEERRRRARVLVLLAGAVLVVALVAGAAWGLSRVLADSADSAPAPPAAAPR